MAKVKVYDFGRATSKATNGKFTSAFSQQVVAIVGTEKVIFSDSDAVHSLHELNGHIELRCKPTDGNTFEKINDIEIHRQYFMYFPVKSLLNSEPIKELELTDAIRNFGSRIECNYADLLQSIKEIGLNPDDYPRKNKEDV